MSNKHIRINAFVNFAPSHLSPGLWTHPQDRSLEYNSLNYWQDLARIAEQGLYDTLFWADGISTYDIYGNSHDAGIRGGLQFPRLDPLLLVSAMASVTEHLGFAVTSSVTYEPPYLFARRMSTLDHLSNGRIGWNIVTSFGDSGVRALGGDSTLPHDQRYDLADDYLQLVYKLWEGSWSDQAVRRDREQGLFADPAGVRKISHQGSYFQCEGVHFSEPSPQRTPFLFQAGASQRGQTFAAAHAEGMFLSAPSPHIVRRSIEQVRSRAQEAGRNPDDILFFSLLTVIVGRTEEEARAKHADYQRYVSEEGALALFSRWSGVDLAGRDPNDVLTYSHSEGMQSTIEGFTVADPERQWTIAELARHNAIGGKGPVLVGNPEQVADAMQAWFEESGVDGFNLSFTLSHQSHQDFVELVIPVLQRRGLYKTAYTPGTLREKLHAGSRGARLPSNHPAARHRFPSTVA